MKIFLLVCLMLVVKSKAAPQIFWKRWMSTLLCEKRISIKEKAIKIKEDLNDRYPYYSWYVNVMDADVSWSYVHDKSSEDEEWKNKCGYNMYIWYKEDSKIDKKPCSSEDISEVERVIRILDEFFLDNVETYINTLGNLLRYQSGIDFHLISGDDGFAHSSSASHLTSPGCSVYMSSPRNTTNPDIFVYLK